MKKIIILALLLVTLSVTCLAADEILIGTPIVDGVLDHLYLKSYTLTVTGADDTFHTGKTGRPDGSEKDSAIGYYLYDDNYLYVCIDVKDEEVYSRGKAWIVKNIEQLSWENDGVEARIYYPELGEAIQANQYIFQCDAKGVATINYLHMCETEHVAATTLNEKGYTVEFAIPLDFDKKAGDEIGLAIEIDDLQEMIQGISTPMGAHRFNAYGSQHPYKNMVKLGTGKAATATTVFDDTKNHAAKNDISYVIQANIFNGTDKGFEPDATMTRAMFATVLGRIYETKVGALTEYPGASKFADVDYKSWYGDYVHWACGAGVINGVGDNKFDPERAVTKQEMAVMLFRFTKAISSGTDIAYADAKDVAEWAKVSVAYCAEKGYITAESGNKFYPKKAATRAQVASLVTAYMKSVKARLY